MHIAAMISAFELAGKRTHLIGDHRQGVLVALDMEGRIFTHLQGEVINRVNPAAIATRNTRFQYENPGGDGLWPAPEGTRLGYQYATGAWSVPAGIRVARYQVTDTTRNSATVEAEVDLVNNQSIGVPVLFSRQITLEDRPHLFTVHVCERVTYVGSRVLPAGTFLLAPWTLCQFDCGPGCYVSFPGSDRNMLWDLYEDTVASACVWADGRCLIPTDGTQRFQVGLSAAVPWIEFHDPLRGLTVRREAAPINGDRNYIDIRDTDPAVGPDSRGIRYSVYADPSGFMEIEAAGGSPNELHPGTALQVSVSTSYHY